MADSTIGITEPVSPNKLLDSESVTVGLNTVERERVQIAGDSATDIAPVTAADGLLVNLGTNNDVTVTGTVTATGPLTDTQLRATPVPVSLTSTTITGTVAVTQSGTWDEVGINDSGNSITVDGTVTANPTKPSTGTSSNVTSSATNVTLQAANANRMGLTVFNDSTKILFVKLGATASSTSFTVKLLAAAYYEVPFGYTGIVDGIWAAANGSARMTELTA